MGFLERGLACRHATWVQASSSVVTTAIPKPVLGYLPNGIHAVEAMLAAASIGAIWSATSPDFGINVSNSLQLLFRGTVAPSGMLLPGKGTWCCRDQLLGASQTFLFCQTFGG